MNHDLTFYGTGAAQGIPDPFCSCRICQNAREKGGHEVRSRSMLRISEEMCIDLGPDTVCQAMRFGDLTQLRHVLVTHMHLDHFSYGVMEVRRLSREGGDWPLHYYLADKAYEAVKMFMEDSFVKKFTGKMLQEGTVEFHRLEYGQTSVISGTEVTPLRGNHDGQIGENSANYLLKLPNGKKLYYGLDTGWYLDETLDALRGAGLDYLVSECTFGLKPEREGVVPKHLHATACERLFKVLAEQGTITENTHIYLSHISHSTSTGAELEAWLKTREFPCPVTLAYDGMQIK